jgi:hypothetical protein
MPATAKLQDPHAERVILRGLLREPDATVETVSTVGLEAGHFYHHHHQLVYDVCRYLAVSGECRLDRVYTELIARNVWRDIAPTKQLLAGWLVEVWAEDPWFPGIATYGEPDEAGPLSSWAAGAAATKVVRLALRRSAAYTAAERFYSALKGGL